METNKKIMGVFFTAMLIIGPAAHAAGVNSTAPGFSLKSIDGNTVSLADLKGNVVFVNFWASWCPPCKVEFPELNILAKEYKTEKFKLLSINVDKKASAAEKFLARPGLQPLELTVLLDPENQVVEKYEAEGMPTSYIIDQQGIVRFVHVGYNLKDPPKWRQEIKQLLGDVKGR